MSKAKNKEQPSNHVAGEVRERILHEAARLFAKNGYSGTGVQQIVEAAATTKPMIYYYFKGKEGLYKELVVEFYTQVKHQLERIDSGIGSVEEQLVAVVQANFDLFKKMPELAWFGFSTLFFSHKDAPEVGVEKLGDENFRLVEQIVSKGIRNGEIEGNSGEIALALSGLVVIYVMAQALRPDRYDAAFLSTGATQRLVRLLLKGIEPR